MLPPIVTKSIEHLTSAVISFAIIMVSGYLVALLLAKLFGGKSAVLRQVIFIIVSFGSLFAAAYYAASKLKGGI